MRTNKQSQTSLLKAKMVYLAKMAKTVRQVRTVTMLLAYSTARKRFA